MIHKKTERGQALLLIVLAAVGLFAFAALAIDGTRLYSDKRHAQNAADTSALAAALASIRCEPCTEAQKLAAAELAARARAKGNGYTNDGVPVNSGVKNTKVVVAVCPKTAGTKDSVTGMELPLCPGIVSGHEKEYIRVWIVSTIDATFGRVLGRPTLTTAAEAIVRVQGGGSSSSGSSYGKAAMISTNQETKNTCFTMNGNGDLYTHNSGVYVNCGDPDKAMFMNSNTRLLMDSNGTIVGCYNDDNLPPPEDRDRDDPNSGWFDPIDCGSNGGVPLDFTKILINFPTMPAVPDCSAVTKKMEVTGGVMKPGYIDWDNVNLSQNTTVQPGLYCFRNGKTLNANGLSLTQTGGGTVTFVFEGNGGVNAGTALTFDDWRVFTVDGNFSVGGANMNVDIFRFYSSGKGNFGTDSDAKVTSGNAYIYLAEGNLNWNSKSIITLTAPKSPDEFAGLLVHKPWGNNSRITFNGGTNHKLTGTVFAPSAPITFNGSTDFELHSQFIGYDFIVDGGGNVDIWYDPGDNYTLPSTPDSTIELTN